MLDLAFIRENPDAVRRAIREKRRLRVTYLSVGGVESRRTVRPLALASFGQVWLLAAWCEMRGDFRDFRADRFSSLVLLDDRFEDEPGRRLADYAEKRQSRG